jgi:peptidoglycan/xylan/chitin deacetylase (PgdA/CDA1 family)
MRWGHEVGGMTEGGDMTRAPDAGIATGEALSAGDRRTPGRWHASALLRASAAWHVGIAAGALVAPTAWPWWVAGLAGNQALLTAAGLWPRSAWLGPNLVRLPASAAARGCIALTIDDGPDPEVTPALLDALAHADARATFFCIGERVAAHPTLARRIVAHGHRIENHTMRHRHDFALMGRRRLRLEIEAAQATIADAVGRTPRFFRAPAGLRSPLLDPVLHALGLSLVAWTRRPFDTRLADPKRIVQRLQRDLGAGDILLVHDGHARRMSDGVPALLRALPPFLRHARGLGLSFATLDEAA